MSFLHVTLPYVRLLKVAQLEEGDSGQYVCVATNAAGTTKHEFQVTVLSPPSLTHQPLTNHTGDSLLLVSVSSSSRYLHVVGNNY